KQTGAMQVQVIWKAQNEANYTNFTVERSNDNGKTFNVVGGIQASDLGTYSLTDKNPSTGQNLYRLKQEDVNDSISYSNIIPIQYANLSNNIAKSNISIYPNPARSTINLAIGMVTTNGGGYNIKITNSSGVVIKQATSNQTNWQASVNDLMPGTYIVRVMNSKDNSFVGNTKFVKE
ncbi:MAG: T9SS type A sorting domain-containing protein, partial [Mucilaginibacter sp.]